MPIGENNNDSSYETDADEEHREDTALATVIAHRQALRDTDEHNGDNSDDYEDDDNESPTTQPRQRAILRPYVEGQEHRRGTQTEKMRARKRKIMQDLQPTRDALYDRDRIHWAEKKQLIDSLPVGSDLLPPVIESERSHSFRKACSERTLEHCRRHAPTTEALAELARAPYLFNPADHPAVFSISAASDELDSNMLRFYIRTLTFTAADLKQRIIDHKKRWPGHEYHWAAWDSILPTLSKESNVHIHYIGAAYKSTPADRHKQDMASRTTQQRFLSTLLRDWPDEWTIREIVQLRWKMSSNGLAKLLPRQLYCVNPDGAEVEEVLIDLASPFSANSAFGGYRAPKFARIPPDLDLVITEARSFINL